MDPLLVQFTAALTLAHEPTVGNRTSASYVERRVTTHHERYRSRFEDMYQQHYGAIWSYVRRRVDAAVDADDVVAQTWLSIWRRIEALPQGNELPWCFGVARHCVANHRRGRDRQTRLTHAVANDNAVTATQIHFDHPNLNDPASPEGDSPTDQRAARVRAALSRLGDHDQEILRLVAWEQLPHADIAVVIDTSVANVAVRLHRAKQRLAQAMQETENAGHTSVTTPMVHPKGNQ